LLADLSKEKEYPYSLFSSEKLPQRESFLKRQLSVEIVSAEKPVCNQCGKGNSREYKFNIKQH